MKAAKVLQAAQLGGSSTQLYKLHNQTKNEGGKEVHSPLEIAGPLVWPMLCVPSGLSRDLVPFMLLLRHAATWLLAFVVLPIFHTVDVLARLH